MGFLHILAWRILKGFYKIIAFSKKINSNSWRFCRGLLIGPKRFHISTATRLKKIPNHLAVVFLPDCCKNIDEFLLHYKNIVEWCLGFEINFLTLYCPDFFDRFLFDHSIPNKLCLFNPGTVNSTAYGVNQTNIEVDYKTSTIIATDSSGQVLKIKLRDRKSWNEEFLWAVENLDSKNKTREEDIYEAIFHNLKNNHFPEANLIIAPGSPMKLYGFPPMQLRIAEFYQNPFPYSLSFTTFLEALQHYSETQQRNGK